MRTVTLPNERLLPQVVEILMEGNSVAIRAKGNSMLPFIVGDRDSVVLKKKDIFAVGDIVLAEINTQQYVLHRIIAIQGSRLILMGDGNLKGTEKCNAPDISGVVVSIIRKGKQIDCNTKCERSKARIWRMLLPIRRYLLAIYRRITPPSLPTREEQ